MKRNILIQNFIMEKEVIIMKKNILRIVLCAVLCLVTYWSAFALTADEILDKIEAKRSINTTQKSIGKMTLTDEKGKQEIRDLVMYSVDDSENTQNRAFIFRFLSPAEVKNVTMLSLKDGEEIYLYMPAFKKVRRIAGSSKKEKFAGTNFSFGDFGGGYTKDDYESSLVSEDEQTYVLDLKPNDTDTDYSKLTMTVDKEKFYFKKIEFFDLEGNPWKVLDIQEVKEETDGSITIMKLTFTDLKDNTKSFLQMESVEKGVNLAKDFFSVRTIQRPQL